jgi:hypothetical protein
MPAVRGALVLIAISVAVAAGCGGTTDSTPTACLEEPRIFSNPERSEVPISECLAENQSGGDLATVGAAMVTAATRLNAEARAERGGEATVQLGYLVGAAKRGEERTEGIHADLLRRLEAAALYSPGARPLPPAFRQAYREGHEAGLSGR